MMLAALAQTAAGIVLGSAGSALPPVRFASARAVAARYGTLALLVVQDGRIVLEEYAPGLRPETRFESNSMHRGLFGLVVAALEDGVLPSVQATRGTLIPDWFPPTDARSRIRVEHLLHGQSGLDDPPFANAADSPGMRLFVGSDLRALVLAQATPFAVPGVVYAGARGGQRVYAIPSRRAVVVRFGAMRYDFDDGAFLNPFLEALDAR
jgi:CubicO group peptidase (beta-lactamase class C family)